MEWAIEIILSLIKKGFYLTDLVQKLFYWTDIYSSMKKRLNFWKRPLKLIDSIFEGTINMNRIWTECVRAREKRHGGVVLIKRNGFWMV